MHPQTRLVQHQISVMSFNIRYGAAEDAENSWEHRRTLASGRILTFDPDLLGIQECQEGSQAEYLRGCLGAYELHGVATDRIEWGGEMTALLYKRAAFEETRRGHFWLSETPTLAGSKSWDSWFARTAVWSELRHRSSGRPLFFLNAHLDYADRACEESMGLIAAWVAGVVQDEPVIVTGDFNVAKDTPAYDRLLRTGVLFDVHRRLSGGPLSGSTYHAYGKALDGGFIDWILASPHFEAVAADVDTYQEGGLFPSDHYPVTAVLAWRGAP